MPAVFRGQAHAVQQHTIEQLGSCGQALNPEVADKLAGDAEERKLHCPIAAEIV